jgi:DNA recombination protein RmuC
MALDVTSLLIGLLAAALPCLALAWQLQRKSTAALAQVALLDERLSNAQLALPRRGQRPEPGQLGQAG